MKSAFLKTVITLSALCLCCHISAASLDLSRASQKVVQKGKYSLGEKIEITYILAYPDTVNLSDISVSLPGTDSIKGLRLLAGPAIASSTTFNSVNGKIEKSSQGKFSFFFTASEPGEYQLPDFIVLDKSKGTSLGLPPVHAAFSVMEKTEDSVASQPTEKKTFLVASLENDTIKKGQSTLLTLRLLSNEMVMSFTDLTDPDVDGCFIKATELTAFEGKIVEYEGENFNEYVLGLYEITPLKAGSFIIGPFSGNVAIHSFDLFAPAEQTDSTISVMSESLILKVEK